MGSVSLHGVGYVLLGLAGLSRNKTSAIWHGKQHSLRSCSPRHSASLQLVLPLPTTASAPAMYGPPQPTRPGARAAQYVRPAGGFKAQPPSGAAATPTTQPRQRYAWQDEREHIFEGGAYANERSACTPDDFMKRLEMAEARDNEDLMRLEDAAGRRVEPRLFGEDVVPLNPHSAKPAAAAKQRLDPVEAAQQRGWGSRSVGVSCERPQTAAEQAARMAQDQERARLEIIAEQRAAQRQQQQQQQQVGQQQQAGQQQWTGQQQHQQQYQQGSPGGGGAMMMMADDDGAWMERLLQQRLSQQPQFRSPSARVEGGGIFPPPCRAVEPLLLRLLNQWPRSGSSCSPPRASLRRILRRSQVRTTTATLRPIARVMTRGRRCTARSSGSCRRDERATPPSPSSIRARSVRQASVVRPVASTVRRGSSEDRCAD